MSKTKSSAIEHFHWVDALRGIAATAIVIFHYHHFYLADAMDRATLPPVDTFPYARYLAPLFGSYAAHAVELFWLISGFVFAHVYLRRKVTIRSFGVARFARLYPLHLATLLYVAFIQWISLNQTGHWQIYGNNDLKHFTLQLLMASNWPVFAHGLSFNGPIWSVSLEILVYGLFLASLPFIRRSPIFVTAALSALSWGWFFFQPYPVLYISRGVFECGGYFFLGSLLYMLRPQENLFAALTLFLLSAVVAACGFALASTQLSVTGVSIATLILFISLDRIAPTPGRRLRVLGDISYSLYLVHVPIQMTVLLVSDIAFDGNRIFANSWLTLPAYLTASVIVAFVVYRWFERPLGQAIRSKLS